MHERTDCLEVGCRPDALEHACRALTSSVDVVAIARQIAAFPAAPLIAELDALVSTLVNAQPRGAALQAGLIGRILGRDLVLQAHPDPVDDRIRLHRLAAHTRAEALSAAIAALADTERQLRDATEALDTLLEQGPGAAEPVTERAGSGTIGEDINARRANHLKSTVESWRAVDAHLAMAVQFGLSVLDRHAQVRDVLLPLWREHGAAAAVGDQLGAPAANTLQTLGDTLARQIRELATLPPAPIPDPPSPSTENTP